MARPLTKSRPISFRLPLDVWHHLETEAAKENTTIDHFIRDLVLRRHERIINPTKQNSAP